MSASPRILVAGIGNIFLGDDAFGVRVVEVLLRRKLDERVRVVDFGIRGLDLAYTLLDPWDGAILIDAVERGEAPGTLFVIEPEMTEEIDSADQGELMQGHSLDPASVLRLVRALGGKVPVVRVVGCEPTPIDEQSEMQMELTEAVAAAVEGAAEMVESIVNELLGKGLSTENQHVHDYIGSRT